MRSVVKFTTLSILSSALMAIPFVANAGGYDSTLTTTVSSPVKIEVRLSDEMTHRANNLPTKLRDRSSGASFNNGFANNGFYGEKDLKRLSERLENKIAKKFAKQGLEVNENAPITLVVTIEDAKPNRPTFKQLSKSTNLSYQSYGIGGAEITGELVDASGNSLGSVDYEWYETDIRDARFGGTWTDAHRAFSRFATKVSKDLAQ